MRNFTPWIVKLMPLGMLRVRQRSLRFPLGCIACWISQAAPGAVLMDRIGGLSPLDFCADEADASVAQATNTSGTGCAIVRDSRSRLAAFQEVQTPFGGNPLHV